VIADHIRATAFLVSDGVNPSNEGRGYVQRRITRRAIRHGYKLGKKTPFFHKLVPDLVAVMGEAYPRLAAQADRIKDVLRVEEERFFETLERGMEILDVELTPVMRGLRKLARKNHWGVSSVQAQTGTGGQYVYAQVTQDGIPAKIAIFDWPSNETTLQMAVSRSGVQKPIFVKGSLVVGDLFDEVDATDAPFDGQIAFTLHDTYGFPLDLTQDVCRERDVVVDEAGFHAAMDKQKAQARAAGKFRMDRALDYAGEGHAFTGYELLEEPAKVVALYADGVAVQALNAGQSGVVVLNTTPFYAESGGQIGDQGRITVGDTTKDGQFEVDDTLKIRNDVFGHHGAVSYGTLKVGDAVTAQVKTAVRAATVRNHSATHLMHKALREVLGTHVQQKGSLVNAERTRFDFAHNAPVTDAQIREIEARVNAEILANVATDASEMDMEAAQKSGAMMLFGEKYGNTVRVLSIGSSKELCGGTHVGRTGDIGLFKIVAESGVAAGVRRVEAVTGENALAYLQSLESTVQGAAGSLKASPSELQNRIGQVLDQVKSLEKEIAALKGKLASSQGDELMLQAVDVKGLKVLAARLEGADAKTLRDTMDKLKDKLKTAVIVLAAVDGDKVQIAAGVTSDSVGKLKAGELVNFVAQQVGGKGGGKADMAMAGGTEPAKVNDALKSVQAWVAERV
jgi:alanyl-tRNA synthetase